MMAAIVVPLVCRSSDSTVSCFEGEPLLDCTDAPCPGAFGLADFEFSVAFVVRECFAERLVFCEVVLLAAIWPYLPSTAASCAATGTSPATGQGDGGRRWRSAVALGRISRSV